MRLLIFTPTWRRADGADAMAEECRAAIEAQQIAGEWEWIIGRDNPYPVVTSSGKPEHQNVLHQYRRARELFLKGGYDALLTVEHDQVLPDRTAVQRLIETPGDVVYAPYLFRHGSRMLSTYQWINQRNLGMSLSNYKTELARARQAVIWRVSGAGFGCTLMRRRVLEALEFRASSINNHCPDIALAEDALRAGFESNGRFDVPVWHLADGRWLNPFREYRKMKYMAVETVRAITAGRTVRLTKGQEIDLTDEEARGLARVGYILYTPAPEVPRDEIGFPAIAQSEVAAPEIQKKSRRRAGASP